MNTYSIETPLQRGHSDRLISFVGCAISSAAPQHFQHVFPGLLSNLIGISLACEL